MKDAPYVRGPADRDDQQKVEQENQQKNPFIIEPIKSVGALRGFSPSTDSKSRHCDSIRSDQHQQGRAESGEINQRSEAIKGRYKIAAEGRLGDQSIPEGAVEHQRVGMDGGSGDDRFAHQLWQIEIEQ